MNAIHQKLATWSSLFYALFYFIPYLIIFELLETFGRSEILYSLFYRWYDTFPWKLRHSLFYLVSFISNIARLFSFSFTKRISWALFYDVYRYEHLSVYLYDFTQWIRFTCKYHTYKLVSRHRTITTTNRYTDQCLSFHPCRQAR